MERDVFQMGRGTREGEKGEGRWGRNIKERRGVMCRHQVPMRD